MDVADWSIAGFHSGSLVRSRGRTGRPSVALAISFTAAAAITGLVEVLIDRIAGPAMTGALGPSATGFTSAVAWVGRLSVSVTAVLVLLALLAWAADAWDRYRMFALAATTVVVSAVVSGLIADRPIVIVLHVSVALAAAASLAIGVRKASLPYIGALWAVALAVVAGQWSLSGLGGGSTLVSRAVVEAALVLALFLLALAVATSSHRKLTSTLGLAAGGGLAAASLASDFTPFVALWATGAILWLPSLVYIAAAGAAGYVLASWLSEPATRHRAAGLVLLAVAGIEPALVHHSATALLALVVLGAHSAREGALSWR